LINCTIHNKTIREIIIPHAFINGIAITLFFIPAVYFFAKIIGGRELAFIYFITSGISVFRSTISRHATIKQISSRPHTLGIGVAIKSSDLQLAIKIDTNIIFISIIKKA